MGKGPPLSGQFGHGRSLGKCVRAGRVRAVCIGVQKILGDLRAGSREPVPRSRPITAATPSDEIQIVERLT